MLEIALIRTRSRPFRRAFYTKYVAVQVKIDAYGFTPTVRKISQSTAQEAGQ